MKEMDVFVAGRLEERWGSVETVPGPARICADLLGCALVFEVLFYYSHRALHENQWLYKNVHSTHHYHCRPVGWTGVHCSSMEMLLSNVLPAAAGPVLLGVHPIS